MPSVTAVNPQTLDWLVLPGHSQVLRHLLRRVALDPEEIASALWAHKFPPPKWDQPLDAIGIERFWQVLTNPEVSQLILQKAEATRKQTQQYLRQAGLLVDRHWAIVDLGWTLKCQRSLRKILQTAYPKDLNQNDMQGYVQGYYLGLLRERLPMAISGPYRAWLIQADSSRLPTYGNCIFQRMNIIEQIFMMADHATTLGYEQQGNLSCPVLKVEHFSTARVAYVEHLHTVVQRYAQELAQTGLLAQPLEMRQGVIANMVALLTDPQRREVQAIANLKVGDDQNESRQQPVAKPVRLRDLIYFAQRLSGKVQSRDFAAGSTWLEGSILLSNPSVRLAYRLALWLQTIRRYQEPLWLYRWLSTLRFKVSR